MNSFDCLQKAEEICSERGYQIGLVPYGKIEEIMSVLTESNFDDCVNLIVEEARVIHEGNV